MAKKRRGRKQGSIYKRADGRRCADITLGYENGKRNRRTFYGASEQEVFEKLTEALDKQHKGEVIPTGRNTVGEFLDQWIEHQVKPYRKPRTAASYESQQDAYQAASRASVASKTKGAARPGLC